MMEWVVPIGLAGILAIVSLASAGWDVFEMRNREVWWWCLILLIEAAVMPNRWMAAVVLVSTFGLWQIGRSWFILRMFTIPMAALAGSYVAITPHLHPWMIPPVLWAGVAVGCGLGIWSVMSIWHPPTKWEYTLPQQRWWGLWGIYEHRVGHHTLCGQGNAMHLVSIAALSVAACVGLIWIGHWWAWGAVPLVGAPLVVVQMQNASGPTKWHPHQGWVGIGALCTAVLLLWWPIVGAVFFVACVGGAILWGRPWAGDNGWFHGWWDSGRVQYWVDAIRMVWWPQGWKHRLIGFGSCTWFPATLPMGEARKHIYINVFTAAHNEYVQQLVEHGIIGVAILLGYIADALWRTSHAGPEGQAVFLLGSVVCTTAALSFPWTFYHEYHPASVREEQWFGSPTVNAWSFVIALLAEAF